MINVLYLLISYNKTVLCEYVEKSGNMSDISRQLLQRIDITNELSESRTSYKADKYVFHCYQKGKYIYLCLSDNETRQSSIFKLLDIISARFEQTYRNRNLDQAISFMMNDDFEKTYKSITVDFTNPSSHTALLRDHIGDVHNIMVENIERVLDRGEKIDVLVDRTDSLQQNAFKFKKNARDVRNKMWWRNLRRTILMILVLLILVYVAIGLTCGWEFQCVQPKLQHK
jgi:vesicle-associated membrane protein 7